MGCRSIGALSMVLCGHVATRKDRNVRRTMDGFNWHRVSARLPERSGTYVVNWGKVGDWEQVYYEKSTNRWIGSRGKTVHLPKWWSELPNPVR